MVKCQICGYDRLNRRTVVYAQKIYPFRNKEIIPICRSCAERIEIAELTEETPLYFAMKMKNCVFRLN